MLALADGIEKGRITAALTTSSMLSDAKVQRGGVAPGDGLRHRMWPAMVTTRGGWSDASQFLAAPVERP